MGSGTILRGRSFNYHTGTAFVGTVASWFRSLGGMLRCPLSCVTPMSMVLVPCHLVP